MERLSSLVFLRGILSVALEYLHIILCPIVMFVVFDLGMGV